MIRLPLLYLALIGILCCHFTTFAQTQHSTFFNDHQSTLRSLDAPSHLGQRINTISVQLPSSYFWAANSGTSFSQFQDFGTSNELSEDEVDDFVNNLQPVNAAGVGTQITPLTIAAKIKNNNEELFTFSLGTQFNANASLFYSRNLAKLIWQGNKQFAGEEISLGPFSANAVAYNEYFFGASAPLPVDLGDITIRPGFRISYITSFGTVHTPTSNVDFYTAQDGRRIDMDLDYRINTSVPEDNVDFSAGTGYKLDLGTSVEIGSQAMASVAVNNIGFTQYTVNTHSYFNRDTLRYEGVETDLIGQQEAEDEEFDVVLDSLQEFFEAEESEESFKAKHGPQLILHGAYRLNEREHGEGDNVRKYHQHNIFITYKQGFQHVYDVTKRAEIQAAYMFNLNTILNVGGNIGYGGFNRFQFGAFASVRGGPFVFSLASNNLLGVFPGVGTGVDGSVSMALNF